MADERWRHIEQLYLSALKVPADQRAGLLTQAGHTDAADAVLRALHETGVHR